MVKRKFKMDTICHIPKFPILECEPFSSINLNFQKNFV
jgi:hypothetical protein